MLIKVFEKNGVYTLITFLFTWQPVYFFDFFKKYVCYFIQLQTEKGFVFQFFRKIGVRH